MKNLILIGVLALVSCGGGESFSGIVDEDLFLERPVSYKLDPVKGPTCVNPSKIRELGSGDLEIYYCTWYCATDSNYNKKYVTVIFDKSQHTKFLWERSATQVRSGICEPTVILGF